jgi:hypothetical protein
VSVVRLIVAKRSNSDQIIKEMPDSVANGTHYIIISAIEASVVLIPLLKV